MDLEVFLFWDNFIQGGVGVDPDLDLVAAFMPKKNIIFCVIFSHLVLKKEGFHIKIICKKK
jgi:hypothetical protein